MALFFIAIALVMLAVAFVVVRTLHEKRALTASAARASRPGRVQRAGR